MNRLLRPRPGGETAGSVEAAVTTIVVDGEEYLTGEDAARALGVKPATLYAYVSRGILKSYRQGTKRRRLYRRPEVEALRRLDRRAPPEMPPAHALLPA